MRDINLNYILRSINPVEKDVEGLFKANKDKINWDWVLGFSERQKILGVFIHSLEKHDLIKELPPIIQERMIAYQKTAQARTFRAHQTLKQLNTALDGEGIPFLILKGFVFANELHDDLSVRPFFDIDFFVPKRFIRAAEEALISIGYKFYCEPLEIAKYIPLGHLPKNSQNYVFPEEITKKLLIEYHHHFQFVLPPDDKRLPLELHWHLFFPKVLRIAPDVLWDNITEKKIDNILIKTLDLEANIIYLATIIAVDGPRFKLISLCDFYRYITLYKNSFDVQVLWHIADKWGADGYLKFSLQLLQRLYDFDNPLISEIQAKKTVFNDICFNTATKSSAIEAAFIDVCKDRKGIKKLICRGKKIIFNLFWDLMLKRSPSRHLRIVIRNISRAIRKETY